MTESTSTPDLDELRALADDAVALAHRWGTATEAGQTPGEKRTSDQLGALLADEAGLDLAVKFVDRVARPEDNRAAARELARLSSNDGASFMSKTDAALMGLGSKMATIAPPVVVPAARARLRQLVGHLLVEANDPTLAKHLAKARSEGFRLNINLLGEAVLGEGEAARRTEETRKLLARDDVDYVSIKISCLVSQISTWDTEGTIARALERLRPLYRVANLSGAAPSSDPGLASLVSSPSMRSASPSGAAPSSDPGLASLVSSPPMRSAKKKKFVNLDMEEYRDLDLTIELFTRLLSEPEFHDLEAGIVLQAYLPDAIPALERLIEFGKKRKAAGGADIKVRLVKGANLAMEKVEAELHDWAQAPYTCKEDVDANYLAFIERATRADAMGVMRLGVASHNLFDIALAHLISQKRGVSRRLDVEMLQGMAPSQARAVKADVGTVLLYTPVVKRENFDVAVSYLIRRLEENAAEQNFLHAMFANEHGGNHGGLSPMEAQEKRFRDSLDHVAPVGPRRSPERHPIGERFANTADSDPALPQVREWALEAAAAPARELTSPQLATHEDVDAALATVKKGHKTWAAKSASERAAILREAARELEKRRGELVSVAMHEGGKTIDQVDPEISEAVDFARYYADRVEELVAGNACDGATFISREVTLVTPPWNFPVAIPTGSMLASLATGSAVIIKPSPQTTGCVEVACEALWAAGIDRDALQVVRVEENEVGQGLIAHKDVDQVILTGSIETGEMFRGWRAGREGGARVFAETSGKNSLIVTPAADLDLAVSDLVKSAFGHAGQKCSAASLGILVGSVATSKRFREQLIDAVKSLRVGYPQDLGVTMGPVIEAPSGKLLRALTTLEPGEKWLVEPKQLDETGRLWSPGLKEGVKPGSFFHRTEVFGPVLGLMTAKNLDEAIELQNATQFGLTAGLHSLDDAEIARWNDMVEAGNCYINRHITGAIVQRQSFGGWKDSVMGPGAKAGGPNYVAQLGDWVNDGLPKRGYPTGPGVRVLRETLAPLVAQQDVEWLDAALASDALAWREEFGIEHDPSQLLGESNVLRYLPQADVVIRAEDGAKLADIVRLLAGAELTRTPVSVSLAPAVADELAKIGTSGPALAAIEWVSKLASPETASEFVARMEKESRPGHAPRVRLIGTDVGATFTALERIDGNIAVLAGEVLANGRRELLTFLREQATSRTLHRFGHVPPELAVRH